MKQNIMQLKGMKTVKREFNSINEFVSYIDEAKTNQPIFGFDDKYVSSNSSNERFTGTKTFDEARELLSKGWGKGSEKLTSALKIANAKMQPKEVKRAIYDIVGFQASVPRYIQGIPTNMVNKKTIKQKQKVMNLYKSVDYNASISTDRILDDSVKFLQILQAIESKGIRVNAFVNWYAVNESEAVFYNIKIKSASERLSLAKMSFPLMHPSMLRRFLFRSLEVENNIALRSWNSGYGRPGATKEAKELLSEKDTYIPVLISSEEATNIISKA